MATNPYFTSNYTAYAAEQTLVHNLTIESHKIFGIDLKYLPRTLENFDPFYGEDTHSSFNSAIELEFYIKSYGGFEGNQFLSKFGLQISEELVLTCARKRFTEEVTAVNAEITRPREGDLIYIPFAVDERMRVFEISHVNQTENFSQLGERYTWEINCRVFGFNGEAFATGDETVDDFDNNYLTTEILLVPGIGNFTMGDVVTQTNGYMADVVNYNTTTEILAVTNSKGKLDTTIPITNSIITRNINHIDNAVANDSGLNDNKLLTTKESVLVDFSESNPFSGF
jgi:hypothetical protein